MEQAATVWEVASRYVSQNSISMSDDVAHRKQTRTKSLHAGQILSVPPSRQNLLTLAEFN